MINMDLILVVIGLWLVIDGLGSIALYEDQSPIEHLVRIIRALCGITLILYSILFLND